MHLQTTEQRYREFLDTLPLSTLRILGRQFGVASASSSHKSGLIDEIVAILTEKVVPGPRTKRGAPAKVTYVDPAILERLNEIKKKGLTPGRIVMEVAQSDERDTTFEDPVHTGLLELTAGGYGFVRAVGAPAAGKEEVYVPAPAVHSLALREGDRVVCTVRRGAKSGVVSLSELLSVNGLPQGSYEERPLFEELTAVSSVEKIGLSEGGDVSLRLVDLFVPVGKGQRVDELPQGGAVFIRYAVGRIEEVVAQHGADPVAHRRALPGKEAHGETARREALRQVFHGRFNHYPVGHFISIPACHSRRWSWLRFLHPAKFS